MQIERDLLPITAVKCDLAGHLVEYFKSCTGTDKKKPCGYYLGKYLCGHVMADYHPAFHGGKDTARARVRSSNKKENYT